MSKRKIVLGITGNFGSGKSAVAAMLRRFGAAVIDADKIYHQLIKPNRPVYKKIISVFGQGILTRGRQIDAKRLAKIVFNKREALKRLNQIAHPAIIRQIKNQLSQLKSKVSSRPIVIDAPLLIEAGLIKAVDKLIVVKTNKKQQLARIKRKWALSATKAMKRINRQSPLAQKIKLADYLIDNSGTLQQTKEQVREIWRDLKRRQR